MQQMKIKSLQLSFNFFASSLAAFKGATILACTGELEALLRSADAVSRNEVAALGALLRAAVIPKPT